MRFDPVRQTEGDEYFERCINALNSIEQKLKKKGILKDSMEVQSLTA